MTLNAFLVVSAVLCTVASAQQGTDQAHPNRRSLLLHEQSRHLQDQAAFHEKAAAVAAAAAKRASEAAAAAADESGFGDKLSNFESQLGDAAGKSWSMFTEVSDKAAAQTTAALRSGLGDVQSMAFSFLKLSDEMVKVLKEMAWNLVTILFLLLVARYLPTDVTLLVVVLTLTCGPFLINLAFGILGFLGYLACWAPNVFMLGLVVALFVTSHLGKAALKTIGVSPEGLAQVPGYDAILDAIGTCWSFTKAKTAPFVKLEDIEAAAGKIKAEPSIEERLAGIEAMLEKAYGRLARGSATEGVSWAS